MRLQQLAGVHRRGFRRGRPAPATHADLVQRQLAADALDMASWRGKPQGTVVHSDRGAQYTSCRTVSLGSSTTFHAVVAGQSCASCRRGRPSLSAASGQLDVPQISAWIVAHLAAAS
jgi:hypothetical protein